MSSSDFWNYRLVKKTRKDHKCNGCREVITANSQAHYHSGVFEGTFYHTYLCPACEEYFSNHSEEFEEGWSDGDIGMARAQEESND